MTKLTLEVGKTYVCRDGREAKITEYDARRSPQFPFVSDLRTCYGSTFTYRADGCFYFNASDGLDLISEKVSEAPGGFEINAMLKAYIDEAVAQALQGAAKPPPAATEPEVPERERRNLAVIAEAKATGKSLQYQRGDGGNWIDSHYPSPESIKLTYRVKLEPAVLYLGVAKPGPSSPWPVRIGAPHVKREEIVTSAFPIPDKVIVLTLDPDTLEVISCVSEAP